MSKLFANKCECESELTGFAYVANFSARPYRATKGGTDFLIVPVVMLRQTVVNKAFVSKDELNPLDWNGVPVTVDHPTDENGEFITARSDIDKFAVGTILNAFLDGDKLKAEAWIDIERADEKAPGLVESLEAGKAMDVSTGYLAKAEKENGSYRGKKYVEAHYDLKPDHLALLPDMEGACSWQDGCGVRANEENGMDPKEQNKVLAAIANALGFKTNARGSKTDMRQMAADLISDDKSPFMPDDQYALNSMSRDTLETMCSHYLGNGQMRGNQVSKDKEKLELNAATLMERFGIDKEAAEKMIAAKSEPEKKPAVTEQPVTAAAIAAEIGKTLPEIVANAVDKKFAEQRRPELVARILANTAHTKEAVEKMDTATLEVIAAGIKAPVVANYGGRGMPSVTVNKDDRAAQAMKPKALDEALKAANGKAA